ncbi:MAG: HD domain-containing protein [Desulfuromonadaceae bacterium]|nr:HD domain-containing protein [Desulfuromonadaceae bacterium]
MTATIPFLKDIFPPSHHGRVFLVGGTVRDMLRGRESQDIDLVSALSDKELTALGFRLVETVSASPIYFKHHTHLGKIEVTRINSIDDLEGDLLRRDFTINAIAMDLSGRRIDPLGGEDDLKELILRTCSDRSFTNDPLRIFRAFRFEADGWTMAPGTAALIRGVDWSEALSAIPIERFSSEMLKALARGLPERFFQRMIEFNVGTEFLPELFRMPEIQAGPLQHHPEGDLFTHSIQVLQRVAALSDDPLSRFCALFHDLGKLATEPALYPQHHGHDEAGFGLATAFCNRLRLPSTYRRALAWVSRLHGKGNRWDELRDSSKIKMAEQAVKAGIARILPLGCTADKPGGPPLAGWDDAIRIIRMSTLELGIDQQKLEAMPTGSRPPFILQKRVDMLREFRTLKHRSDGETFGET